MWYRVGRSCLEVEGCMGRGILMEVKPGKAGGCCGLYQEEELAVGAPVCC